MERAITYVGLDVHKDTISVATAVEAGGVRCVNMGRLRIHRRP